MVRVFVAMTPLKIRIATLWAQVRDLPQDWGRVDADFEAGSIDVVNAKRYLQQAQMALEAGDEAKATISLLDAYTSWSMALKMQIPSFNINRLSTQPDVDRRPSKDVLAMELFVTAGGHSGSIVERCLAALDMDEALAVAFGGLQKTGLVKAYRRGEKALTAHRKAPSSSAHSG
jgi:hypothetical protein